jgi:hypothetical protein
MNRDSKFPAGNGVVGEAVKFREPMPRGTPAPWRDGTIVEVGLSNTSGYPLDIKVRCGLFVYVLSPFRQDVLIRPSPEAVADVDPGGKAAVFAGKHGFLVVRHCGNQEHTVLRFVDPLAAFADVYLETTEVSTSKLSFEGGEFCEGQPEIDDSWAEVRSERKRLDTDEEVSFDVPDDLVRFA